MSQARYAPDSDTNTQRVRNILTLEERVNAIQSYDRHPVYTKIAKMFNCSWEQIKNIIANREAILEFYEATRNSRKQVDANREDLRRRELDFLGACIYEYLQRAQYHQRIDLSEELIRTKALEFRDIIMIKDFVPNKSWLNLFKATYNISLSNRQIVLTRQPPSSLDLKDIITYCSKYNQLADAAQVQPRANAIAATSNINKTSYRVKTREELHTTNQAVLDELKERRKRKIDFMERALYEYIQRLTFHSKVPIPGDRLRQVAIEFRDLLKIDNFFPDKPWLIHFKHRFNFSLSQDVIVSPNRTPPLSLDLRDILSYCSRRNVQKGQNQTPTTVKLALKDKSESVEVPMGKVKVSSRIFHPTERCSIRVKRLALPDTIQPTLSSDPAADPDDNVHDDDDVVPIEVKHETIEINDDDDVDSALDTAPTPPLKIRKIESLCESVKSESNEIVLSPIGHWSPPDNATLRQTEQLPTNVRNYDDALKLLKPLEEFAMLEENYRVIGLITQLEEIFKNPPKKNDADYEHE